MGRSLHRVCIALSMGLGAVACSEKSATPPPAASSQVSSYDVAMPATSDTAGPCIDIGSVRVCYGGEPRMVPRPLPVGADPERWRCTGTGGERRCYDRWTRADAFACKGTRCIQRHPRMPDDTSWECGDVAGIVACRGRTTSANASGVADPGWICGARNGHPGERLCLDPSPDRPPGSAPYRCRYEQAQGPPQRICERGREAQIGGDCRAGCPAGSQCLESTCVPKQLRAECWGDKDCKLGRCALLRCEAAR
ncbi:MAG: hypothetical protein R3B13_35950 [Polyangiaceae bacterium]